MKISKLFHWLYAAVMFLPLFLFPIFALAVRSDNNFEPISIDTPIYETVDFNQQVLLDSQYEVSGVQYSIDFGRDNYIDINFVSIESDLYPRLWVANNNFQLGDKVYVKTNGLNSSGALGFRTHDLNGVYHYYSWFGNIITLNEDADFVEMYTTFIHGATSYHYSFNVCLFNLTQMFGFGNEPTLEVFNSYFNSYFYPYTLGEDILINVGVHSYNDSDVGSQMVYVSYKVVDNYFNYDNVFNFGSLYSWLEINFFNGAAPMGFFIFWHLLIYWLLTSLIWLLFDVLMYVPQLVHRWLDKASIS